MVQKELLMDNILGFLRNSNKEISVYELTKKMGHSYGSIIRIVDILEMLNEIKSRHCKTKENRKVRLISLK